jgi:hypothetical protein
MTSSPAPFTSAKNVIAPSSSFAAVVSAKQGPVHYETTTSITKNQHGRNLYFEPL